MSDCEPWKLLLAWWVFFGGLTAIKVTQYFLSSPEYRQKTHERDMKRVEELRRRIGWLPQVLWPVLFITTVIAWPLVLVPVLRKDEAPHD